MSTNAILSELHDTATSQQAVRSRQVPLNVVTVWLDPLLFIHSSLYEN